MKAREFLTREERKQITDAIVRAEHAASGEIRIHIESNCPSEPKERALRTFHILRMTRTSARNAVLIYVASESRKFAVLGDKGIDAVVPHGFWKDVCALLATHFSSGAYAQGLEEAVLLIGEKLQAFFPYREDDVNELPDEISFGDEEEEKENHAES